MKYSNAVVISVAVASSTTYGYTTSEANTFMPLHRHTPDAVPVRSTAVHTSYYIGCKDWINELPAKDDQKSLEAKASVSIPYEAADDVPIKPAQSAEQTYDDDDDTNATEIEKRLTFLERSKINSHTNLLRAPYLWTMSDDFHEEKATYTQHQYENNSFLQPVVVYLLLLGLGARAVAFDHQLIEERV